MIFILKSNKNIFWLTVIDENMIHSQKVSDGILNICT